MTTTTGQIRLSAPRRLEEPGKFAVYPSEQQSIRIQGFVTKSGLYISQQSHDALERVRNLLIDTFVQQSGKWFSRELGHSAVEQRFKPISTKWTESADLPAWAFEMYPFVLAQPIAATWEEICADLVLSRVVVSTTVFHAEFSLTNVHELIEKIPLEDEPVVEAPLEIVEETVAAEATLLDTVELQAATEDTRVVRLERGTPEDEGKQRAKERLRRAKIRALLEKLRAEAEEDEYKQQFPDTDDDDVLSEDEGGLAAPNVVIRKTD